MNSFTYVEAVFVGIFNYGRLKDIYNFLIYLKSIYRSNKKLVKTIKTSQVTAR